jgi:16S rRNA (adenine1518-N6/adenine1519-N6)-dimethyltransferase
MTSIPWQKIRALGQYLTIDKKTIECVVSLADIRPSDTVLEIGTGTGSLTRELSLHAKQVVSYEIDPAVAEIAQANLKDFKNIKLILGDAFSNHLQFDTIVSCLPYSQSHRFVTWLALQEFRSAFVVLQREFYQKLVAKPHSEHYKAVSVLSQLCFHIKPFMDIPPKAFTPRPKVHSKAIRIDPIQIHSRKMVLRFYPYIQRLFGFRRKTVKRVVHRLLPEVPLEQRLIVNNGLPSDFNTKRIYELAPSEILHLLNRLQSLKKSICVI